MDCLCMYIFLFLLLLHLVVMSPVSPAYIPADNILINCGELLKTVSPPCFIPFPFAPPPSCFKNVSLDGREWDTDASRKVIISSDTFNPLLAADRSPSVEDIPYSTARIHHSKFTYTIRVSTAGQKFLRLYFYPASYLNFNGSVIVDTTKSYFSVDAANHNLLSNFNPFLNLQPGSFTLVKEYVITVNQSLVLEVTFTPSPNSLYAFVNGIEIVSIPDHFYIKGNDTREDAIKMMGQIKEFYIGDSVALEKLYRLNVGGSNISSTNDTGMFRSWDDDSPYMSQGDLGYTSEDPSVGRIPINYTLTTPPYTAPRDVYSTTRTQAQYSDSNLTWSFQVDSGFNYLLRLYFYKFIPIIPVEINKRAFSIFINHQTAEQSADVISWSGGMHTPVYKDYAVFVSHNPDDSKPYLRLILHPNNIKNIPDHESPTLNGLEIFKLSQPGGSLAVPSPELGGSLAAPSPELVPAIQKSGTSQSTIAGASIGGSLGALLLILLIVGFPLFRRRRKKTQVVSNKFRSTTANISLLPPVRSRIFSMEEIKLATTNFDDNFVIGKGGFGNVYKGYIKNGTYPVAIKRLNPSSRQGAHEFQTEITILSNLRHRHLVPLIGCCDDRGEMILVYDYMVHGTLRGHLYGGNSPPLSWKRRLLICIGAARGLHYLHAGAECMIIHRDVKSTNILLDEKMVAKVSDFGLSKIGPNDTSVTHMSTIVKGSFGYLDPEYYLRLQLTTKSDVYSFGVVLFEVLCARPVLMQDLPHEQMNLAEWSRNCYRKGNLGEIVDKNITGEIAAESLNKFGEVGYNCLRDHGIDRPTMGDVVLSLETALQLQESCEKVDQGNLFSTKIVTKSKCGEASTSSTSSDGFKSGIGSVFSDILNPNAR